MSSQKFIIKKIKQDIEYAKQDICEGENNVFVYGKLCGKLLEAHEILVMLQKMAKRRILNYRF